MHRFLRPSLLVIALLAGSTSAESQLIGDLNLDYTVDFKDIQTFAWQWLNPTCLVPGCIADLDGVDGVNAADFALLANNWQRVEPHIVISEFMASNASNIPLGEGELLDGDGESSDWIEIYNPTDTAISLDGWYLTDNDANLTMWQFPNGLEVKPGQFLIVFASEKTYDLYPYNYPYLDAGGYYHTNFNLDKDEDYLALVASDGSTIAHEYAPQFPKQLTNVSYGLAQYAATLVPTGANASYHVPASIDAILSTVWFNVDFNDSLWDAGPTSLGFGDVGGSTGTILREYWTGIAGQSVSDLTGNSNFPDNPSGSSEPTLFEAPTGWAEEYGTRMQGFIHPPVSGLYTFWIASDDNSELWLSTSADPANKSVIAYVPGWTESREWNRFAAQQSSSIMLIDGQKYYIEALHKEGTGGDNLAVTWEGPSVSRGNPIDGQYLSSWTGGWVATDVQDDMLGVNASLWTRIEFYIEEGEEDLFDTLSLRIKYEDGFVAYLNGRKVASRNDPDPVEWNSKALSDRPDEDASVFEEFNLNAFLSTLQSGKNVLAIHGLNNHEDNGKFMILPELVAARNRVVPEYFTKPTPGTFNISGAAGRVSDIWVSTEGTFYTGPPDWHIPLTLSTATDGAEIRYTLDGSRPTIGHGLVFDPLTDPPLEIDRTTVLRAVGVKPGWLDSSVETNTYIFLDDVIKQSPTGFPPGPDWPDYPVNGQVINYGMDPCIVNDPVYGGQLKGALKAIPTISLVTDLANLFDPLIGIYVNARSDGRAWERPVSVELINPDGSEGFHVDAGLRIRGGYSRGSWNPKHAFRLLFRAEYGQAKLEYPLFGDEGVDEFDNVDLRTSQNYSWAHGGNGGRHNTMVREVFSRDIQGAMGHPYTRSRYYHLYINGHYWGLFQTQERAEASHAKSYLGGDKDDYDVIKTPGMLPTDGNRDALDRLYDQTMLGLDDYERYYRVQGLNLDGTRNPNYERLLDVDNVIDFMIIEYYTGDRDGPASRYTGRPNNTWGSYNRVNPDGWKWFHHDNEHSLGAGSAELNMVTPFSTHGANRQDFNPHWLHEQLANINLEYRLHFADHVYKHFFNDGLLEIASARKHIQDRADQIGMAIIGESARWGDSSYYPPRSKINDWLPEINRLLYDTFDRRHLTPRVEEVLGQFRNVGWYPNLEPPGFNQNGGAVTSGFGLTMSNPNGYGNIYYTLNGSDPRQALSGNPIGTNYTGPINLTKSTHVKARVLDGSTWSALNEAIFAIGPAIEDLRITEIMYHPRYTGNINDPNEEFIELTNIGQDTLNINL
ncbi:MAG: lamin tail domain-containing protein, partial [Planctomycetota bacterium]